jgi:hypothetical protein
MCVCILHLRRIKNMINQRKSLVEERKRAAAQTRIQKESIAKVMDEVRTNASKANKIIAQAMTGKITLETLTAPSPGKGTKKAKRRSSAGAGSGGGGGRRGHGSTGDLSGTGGSGGGAHDRKVNAERMGLGRETKSAGQDAAFESEMENPANRKNYSLPSLPPQNAPQLYKSPYDGIDKTQ